jgi:hypothetical protein
MIRNYTLTVLFFCLIVVTTVSAQESPSGRPFIMPMETQAGPSTWMFGQPYGNTVGAYNFGTAWYSAGQGLHFGVDISMACGTPLLAVADGEVIYVDNLAFGAGPHNLILRHPEVGVTTLYGHLLDVAPLQQFALVRQGQLVGYSGDPDETCDSRPHLHLEVRSLDYRTALNPVDYIESPWDALAAIGPFNANLFQQDFYNPRQWVYLNDQPAVAFGGARLNAYSDSWPPANERRAPGSAWPLRPFTSLADSAPTMRPIGLENCCITRWWHPTNSNWLYMVDGTPGQLAAVFEWDVNTGTMTGLIKPVPPPMNSPDGTHEILVVGGQISIRRLSDNAEWPLQTAGFVPMINPTSTRLLWQAQYGQFVPGGTPPPVEIWVSNLDGSAAQQVLVQPRVSASWLDGDRLLLSATERTVTTLSVYDLRDGTSFTLGSWDRLRGVSVAPGGQRLLFYQVFQPDTSLNVMNVLEIQPGAVPQRLPWFGGWRWRDHESVFYVPFEPDAGVQRLAYYHVPSGENRMLTDPNTQPFIMTNGDWSVSPDGRRVVFQDARDRRMWLLEFAGA